MGKERTNYCIADRHLAGDSIEDLAYDYDRSTEEITQIISEFEIEVWHPDKDFPVRVFPIGEREKANALVDRWNSRYSLIAGEMELELNIRQNL